IAILKIECHPAWVDVNVHPTKKEVRFQDGSEIYAFVKSALKQALIAAGAKRFEIANFSINQSDIKFSLPNFNQSWPDTERSRSVGQDGTHEQPSLINDSPLPSSEPVMVPFQILGQIYKTYILMLYQNQF